MQSLNEIKSILSESHTVDALKSFIMTYESDERAGVRKLTDTAGKRIDSIEKELARLKEMRKFENENRQFGLLCGIDEVGRGPLAGPVYAAAVILPEDVDILYINDSKKLSEKKREELYDIIMDKAVATDACGVTIRRITRMEYDALI